ncbi:MAG: SDR family NAD(P)-dependent oxidoreductase [Dehalococcoidia bacterium]
MLETLDLEGRAVVITGGSRGLGRGMAFALADAGARLMLAARTQDELDATVEEVRARGGTVAALRTDVTDSAQVDALVAACVREYGKIDVMFANAGAGGRQHGEIWECTDEDFDALIATNLNSVFYAGRAAARAMIEQGTGGSVVSTTSAGAYRGSKNWVYAAAKAGVVSLTKTMARSLGPHGVRSNTIVPGMVSQHDAQDDEERARRAQQGSFNPGERIGEWWELGPLAVFLASDASSYVTGQEFFIDGGMVNAGLAPAGYRPHHEF